MFSQLRHTDKTFLSCISTSLLHLLSIYLRTASLDSETSKESFKKKFLTSFQLV